MSKILVADDSIAVRKVAERLLTEAGLGVALAANGEEAMAYLAKDRADVIVSDVIMPDKSGYEVCAFVRNHSSLASTPVLLISGIVNDEVTKQAEFCRADGVLKKPFQGTSLKDKVFELLAKRQSPAAVAPPKPGPALIQTAATAQPAVLNPPPIVSPVQPPSLRPTPMQEGALGSDRRPGPTGHGDPQLLNKVKEVEGQLRAEQARTESLAKRITDLEGEVSRAKETEALLEAERRRVSELEAKAATSELQLSRISQLEASLREEQESGEKARQEAAAAMDAWGSIAQLEAALDNERNAAAQLVQQVTDLEAAVARGKNAEAMLAQEMDRTVELQQKTGEAEALLSAVRAKVADLETELAATRDRNAVLVQRVSETEQVAVNAAKHFEEMARKLGEIARLAAQVDKGTRGF